ncbi:MAG: hypothetical protein ACRC8Y_10950, partial [Chroococcales cyanobacterium]
PSECIPIKNCSKIAQKLVKKLVKNKGSDSIASFRFLPRSGLEAIRWYDYTAANGCASNAGRWLWRIPSIAF